MKVVVIGGGRNCEHDVSLASAASVSRTLRERHEVIDITIGRDGVWRTDTASAQSHGDDPARSLAAALSVLADCDVVFPALHGPLGEDGCLAALCELADVPYVGSPVGAGALAMDKWATKAAAAAIGVATAPGILVRSKDVHESVAPLRPTWTGGPTPAGYVVKPVAAGSSYGVSLLAPGSDPTDAVTEALTLDDRVLIEEYISGREVDIAVLARPSGLVFGEPLEIVVDGIFDTVDKYGGRADFRVPADLTRAERAELFEAAATVFTTLGCRGVARVDFFLTEDQGVVLNEVNTMPGLTEHSQVPRMFAAAGIEYVDLLDALVLDAAR